MYFEGSQVDFSRSLMYFALIMANNEDPDEMQHYAAFHLSLHCFSRYPFRVSRIQKGKYAFEPRHEISNIVPF